jgi:Ca2+-binding RTX toxin-like protein
MAGGLGQDRLTGGAGADRLAFGQTLESAPTPDGRDIVHDSHRAEHDLLDLAAVDADAGRAGHQTLAFVGQSAFSGVGQVRFFLDSDHTVVEVNTAGSGAAEMQVQVAGHVDPTAGDFLL